MVQDILANQDVFVNTPTMLSGRSQLEPNELVKNRKWPVKESTLKLQFFEKEMCQSRVQLVLELFVFALPWQFSETAL